MASECANPLLLAWVGEWLEDARRHSSKGVTTYKNAYESLKACPIEFNHPSEAKILKGLGDKLCARLTDKMTQHCQSIGALMPPMPHKRRRVPKTGDADESDEVPTPKKIKKSKPYVPKERSGTYAIMLALSSIYEEQPRGITKQELIELAQGLCDSSFTITDPTHGKFYTAWNSMKTLQEKDLVFETGKRGSVRKYGLTDEGWETVQRMKKALPPGQQTLDKSFGVRPPGTKAVSSRDHELESEAEVAPPGSPNPFLRDDDGFLENQRRYQELTSKTQPPKVSRRAGGGPTKAKAASSRKHEHDMESEPEVAPQRSPNPYLRDDDDFLENQRRYQELISKPQPPKASRKAVGFAGSMKTKPSNHETLGSKSRSPFDFYDIDSPEVSRAPLNLEPDRDETSFKPRGASQSVGHAIQSNPSAFPTFTPIELLPRSFTVHLALDNREVRSQKDRDYIEEELLKLGIKIFKRALPVGDMLWVAKCHDPSFLPRHGAEGDEVLLDHIVERKRLDDLIGSMMDKRYDEQKFRLARSGARHVSYVIEHIALTEQHLDPIWRQRVDAAVAKMQVVHGFFVKRTAGLDATIRHLARMTRRLERVYADRAILVIPPEHVDAAGYAALRGRLARADASAAYQITYGSFAALTSKSDSLTLRDVFVKMLMCTKGITSEKALEIQKRWTTPYALLHAYQALGEGPAAERRKREFLATSLDHVVARKKIPKAVSIRAAAVWGGVDEV